MHETVPRCPHARNEKPGGASARAAAPRPARFLVTPYARAQGPALCAHSRGPAVGTAGARATPKRGGLGIAFRRRGDSGRCATVSGAGHRHVRCQADVNASAVGV